MDSPDCAASFLYVYFHWGGPGGLQNQKRKILPIYRCPPGGAGGVLTFRGAYTWPTGFAGFSNWGWGFIFSTGPAPFRLFLSAKNLPRKNERAKNASIFHWPIPTGADQVSPRRLDDFWRNVDSGLGHDGAQKWFKNRLKSGSKSGPKHGLGHMHFGPEVHRHGKPTAGKAF